MRQEFTISGVVHTITEQRQAKLSGTDKTIITRQLAIMQHGHLQRDEPTYFQFKNEKIIPLMELQPGDAVIITFQIVSNTRAHSKFNNLHATSIKRIWKYT